MYVAPLPVNPVTVPLPTTMSAAVNPVTGSLKVAVTGIGLVLVGFGAVDVSAGGPGPVDGVGLPGERQVAGDQRRAAGVGDTGAVDHVQPQRAVTGAGAHGHGAGRPGPGDPGDRRPGDDHGDAGRPDQWRRCGGTRSGCAFGDPGGLLAAAAQSRDRARSLTKLCMLNMLARRSANSESPGLSA